MTKLPEVGKTYSQKAGEYLGQYAWKLVEIRDRQFCFFEDARGGEDKWLVHVDDFWRYCEELPEENTNNSQEMKQEKPNCDRQYNNKTGSTTCKKCDFYSHLGVVQECKYENPNLQEKPEVQVSSVDKALETEKESKLTVIAKRTCNFCGKELSGSIGRSDGCCSVYCGEQFGKRGNMSKPEPKIDMKEESADIVRKYTEEAVAQHYTKVEEDVAKNGSSVTRNFFDDGEVKIEPGKTEGTTSYEVSKQLHKSGIILSTKRWWTQIVPAQKEPENEPSYRKFDLDTTPKITFWESETAPSLLPNYYVLTGGASEETRAVRESPSIRGFSLGGKEKYAYLQYLFRSYDLETLLNALPKTITHGEVVGELQMNFLGDSLELFYTDIYDHSRIVRFGSRPIRVSQGMDSDSMADAVGRLLILLIEEGIAYNVGS